MCVLGTFSQLFQQRRELPFINTMAAYGTDFYWRDFVGCIPRDAVSAGHGLYVGQGVHDNILLPGALYEPVKFIFEHHGKMKKSKDIKILCTQSPFRFNWEPIDDIATTKTEILHRALQVGYEEGTRWYIGRVCHENEWKVGKVDLTGSKRMHIWNADGTTHLQTKFELLTYNS